MTLAEFKEKIAASPSYEWFQNYSVRFQYPHLNIDFTAKGVVSIYEFVLRQIEGFNGFTQLPQELQESRKKFIAAKDHILRLVNTISVSKNTWNNDLDIITNPDRKIFTYDSPETNFLVKVYVENQDYYNGAYGYIVGQIHHFTDKKYLAGYFLAYEFTSRDFSKLAERKDAEKKSISTLRSDFQKELSEAENQLTGYLHKAHEQYVDYSNKIDQIKSQKETLFTGWFNETGQKFTQFFSDSNNKVQELEKLYHEKLKLEAPAKYWQERAIRLKKDGFRWLIGLIVSVLVAIAILVWILYGISTGSIEKIFQNTGTAIKWSVVLITLISFLAFVIRIFSKLTFSAFHLVRDAEEREQLTYVYLALKKEKAIDQTERHLIMQSLFSRADSGLLKEDASPTMPGNIVDKVITK